MMVQGPSSLPQYMSESQRQRLDWVYRKLRVEVVSAMWWHVGSDWEMVERRLHDDFFFCPVSQRLEAQVAGASGTVLAGGCMFVCAGEQHAARMPQGVREIRIVSIHAHLDPLWGGTVRQLVAGAFKRLPDGSASEQRMARVTHLMGADAALGRQAGEEMIRDWLAFWALEEVPQAREREPVDVRVEQAIYMIHTRFSDALTVEGLAQAVKLKEVQFRKLFRKAQGEGPKAYLANYRLSQAAKELRLGTASVKEVAHGTGFTDVHYFHLAFRRKYGCTPVEYRRQGVGAV